MFYAVRFLFVKEEFKKQTNLLVLLFLLLAYIEAFTLFAEHEFLKPYSLITVSVFAAVSITLAPTVFSYIRAIIIGRQGTNYIRHFAPAVIVLVLDLLLFLGFYLLEDGSSLRQIVYYAIYVVTLGSIVFVFVGQSVLYSIWSYRLIKNHEKKVGEVVSFEEEVSLKWTRVFLFGYLLFFVSVTISSYLYEILHVKYLGYAFDLIVIVYLLYIGSQAVRQFSVHNTIVDLTIKLGEDDAKDEVEEKAIEQIEQVEDRFEQIRSRLESYMKEHKPYLQQDLTIFDLSKQLDTNYKYLSKIINNDYNMNFATYINEYRIEEAKSQLTDEKGQIYKIEAIANMVGFKSKSAFNNAFKKMVGVTPSQFRDEN